MEDPSSLPTFVSLELLKAEMSEKGFLKVTQGQGGESHYVSMKRYR